MKKTDIKVICGPTASGKTAMGIEYALANNGEVVSADSMQIYKGIPIATAQPTESELKAVRHHLVGFLEVGESYSVADFVKDADEKIRDIVSRGKKPVIVGGTGLYIESLVKGVEFASYEKDEEYMESLRGIAAEKGADYLHAELYRIDPTVAEKIEKNNLRRIISALEVYHTTGKTLSEVKEESLKKGSKYSADITYITFDNREDLYDRINRRVDLMVEAGLVEEARLFRNRVSANGAGQAIGHKEMYPYLDGELSLEECVNNLKTATRHYAKRQITWFNRFVKDI